jgi:hypothetical protein
VRSIRNRGGGIGRQFTGQPPGLGRLGVDDQLFHDRATLFRTEVAVKRVEDPSWIGGAAVLAGERRQRFTQAGDIAWIWSAHRPCPFPRKQSRRLASPR